jgi:hypothetical protein
MGKKPLNEEEGRYQETRADFSHQSSLLLNTTILNSYTIFLAETPKVLYVSVFPKHPVYRHSTCQLSAVTRCGVA